LDQFLEEADLAFQTSDKSIPIEKWVEGIRLISGPFSFEGHEYQREILMSDAQRMCLRKGSQLGVTEAVILRILHGLLFGKYSQGALVLMPTVNDVQDYSKSRFGSLISDNEGIAKYVSGTDSVSLKKVRRSFLHLRGARVTGKIEGIKKSSSQLKSIPCDVVLFDESDEMDSAMIDLALERLGHSSVKEEIYLSTPSIPDYGISKLYDESDQRVWAIRCGSCGTETVLEDEFPSCLVERADSSVYRACKKNKDHEIFPKDGHWIPKFPERSKDMTGYYISQLNSAYADLRKILRRFNDSSKRNIGEFYNSVLGQAWISAENRLTVQDVYANCGQSPMLTRANGPCCMGVDVGAMLHVVVGYKPREEVLQVCYLARVSSFNDLHDIAQRFNVGCAVIDIEPETRKAREWANSEDFPVFLCDYLETITEGKRWDEEKKTLKVNRTESLDGVHDLVSSSGLLILPRRCEEVEEFAKELVNTAKVLEEDSETGSREYRYRKLGPDHYAHGSNYCILAASKISTMSDPWGRERPRQEKAVCDFDPYSYNTEGESGWNPFD
jgi:hypothetical protein